MSQVISGLELDNFQSHGHTVLEFSALTALVGPSSSGKSATERALLWALYGDWDACYPADNSKPTRATIILPNGTRIVRQRLGDKQHAWIIPPDMAEKDVKPFKDFGAEIPGVFDLINLRPIIAGKEKVYLNFAHQEPKKPFLVGDTKPAKAQMIGRLYGAHVVNAMLRILSKDKLDLGRRVKEKDADLAALAGQMGAYASLDAHEEAVKRAETAHGELQDVSRLSEAVSVLRGEARAISDRRWLLSQDFSALRSNLRELSELSAIRDTVDLAAGIARQISPRRWLLSRDTATLAAAVTELAALEATRTRLAAIQTGMDAVSGNKMWHFSSSGLREKLSEYEEFGRINVAFSACMKAVADVSAKADRVGADLAAARGRLSAAVFSSGECPLCHAAVSTDFSSAELADRLRHLAEHHG